MSDQIVKRWIVANFEPYRIYPVLDDWLRVDYIHNDGGLFGLAQGAAPVLAAVSLVVIGLLGWMEIRWGWRSRLTTLALSLLLGGAIGNLIDRIQLGYVRDFADIGMGGWRWYIFNIADMAVTCFFLTVVVIWIFVPNAIPGSNARKDDEPSSGEGPVAG